MGVTLTDDQLTDLLHCLRKHPGSEKICGEIVSKQEHVMCDYEFIVDAWPDVKAVVTRSNPKSAKFKFAKHCVNVFATDADALKSLLQSPGAVNWSRKALFSGVSQDHFMLVKDVIREHNIPSYMEESCVMMKASKDKLKLRPIPDGFQLRNLESNQCELVNSQWNYSRGDVSNTYIKHLIETRPSCCLYNQEGDLLGYALTFHYGCVGLLHVREEHRGKGYAKVIVSHLTDKCFKAGIEAFVFVEGWNKDATRLYEDVGFEPMSDKHFFWICSNK